MLRVTLLVTLVACGHTVDTHSPVEAVRYIHGAPSHGTPGPWALIGYRIGANALSRLSVQRVDAFALSVIHRAPAEFRYTCMLDGLMASTGASPGKMNLEFQPVTSADMLETIVEHKKSGRRLRYTIRAEAARRFANTDYDAFPKAAAELEKMSDAELFETSEPRN